MECTLYLPMIYLLSLLPILVLLILSLTKGVKPAVMLTLVITILLFFYWGAGFTHFFAALSVSLLTTVNILMIVLGATFLYNIMSKTGLINDMIRSLDNLHPSPHIRFFIVAFGLTAFFEGVAGFGTPGAIVPLILIAMGYEALLSVSVVLLFDCLFSMFGAVGTPIISGLQIPLMLDHVAVQKISFYAALFIAFVGMMLVIFIFRDVNKQKGLTGTGNKKELTLMYLFFAIPYCTFAWFAPELASVMGALMLLLLSVWYLKDKGEQMDLIPWIPYTLLALMLLLPKLWAGLRQGLSWELKLSNIMDTGISGAMQPLLSPLIPFLIVGLGVAFIKKSSSIHIKASLVKVANVFVVLFPSIAIAQLMIASGAEQPSMVQYIGGMMSKMGQIYPLFSPFVGVLGTFITGSTTISNLVFAPSQVAAANVLLIDENTILALQLAGASAGNAICLFNIIAAASVAGIQDYRGILSKNLGPTIFMGLLLGLFGMIVTYFFS